MFIQATLKMVDSKNVGIILKKFFERINSENSISINDGLINLKYYFEEYIPGAMLEAIGAQEILSFSFNNTHHNSKDGESEIESIVKPHIEKNLISEEVDEASPLDKSFVQQKIEEIRQLIPSSKSTCEDTKLNSKEDKGKFSINGSTKKKCSKSVVTELADSEKEPSTDISLEQLAKQASTYEEFVESVVKLLNLNSKEEFFRICVEAASIVPKITWKNLEAYCTEKGIIFGTYERITCTKKVAEMFGKEGLSILQLFKQINEYKNTIFNPKKDENKEENSTSEQEVIPEKVDKQPTVQPAKRNAKSAHVKEKNVQNDAKLSQPKKIVQGIGVPVQRYAKTAKKESSEEEKTDVKNSENVSEKSNACEKPNAPAKTSAQVRMSLMMKCMPEIPYFENILKNIDMTKPVENRVRYVLTAIGLLDFDEDMQRKILELATTAVNIKNPTLDTIFMKTNIEFDEVMEVRAYFGKLINTFVAKSVPNMKIKMLDFLKDLQCAVMMPYEIVD